MYYFFPNNFKLYAVKKNYNVLLNLTKHQRPDIDKIYLYVKDPLELKYQLLINGREKVGIER